MQKQPLLILCLCFIAGIVVQDLWILSRGALLLVLLIALVMQAVFFLPGFLAYQLRKVSLGFLFLIFGLAAHELHSTSAGIPIVENKSECIFKLRKKLNSNEKNRRYEIVAWQNNHQFRSVLSVPRAEPELDYMHYYKASLYINALEKPYSDFQFNYQKYLARKGIYYQSYLPGNLQREKRSDLSFSEKIRQARLQLLRKIDAAPLQKRTREFAKGIILADRTEMDQETLRDFRNSGTMHILAISGTHMAIIFGVILAVFNVLLSEKYRNLKIILALVLIWTFAVFIDYGNSVIRSCIMISCYYIFRLLQRKTDLLHALSLAAFVILFIDSNQVFDVGFQLSFSAVLGIFWFNQPLLKRLPLPKNKVQNLLLNIVSISIAAQLATLPLVIYYFHQYSSISLLANLIIIPFAEIIIVFSLLMVGLIGFSLNFMWLNQMFDTVIAHSLKAVHYFGDLDFALHEMIPLTLLEVALLAIILYFLRPLIIKINIRNLTRVAFFIVLFVSLRFLLNYRARSLDEILVHHFFNHEIYSVKKGGEVIFYLSDEVDREKVKQYVIMPYLTSRRTKNYVIKKGEKHPSEFSLR